MDLVTPADLRRLVQAGETFTTEFKRARGLNDSDIVNAVVCMANGKGGHLLLGVEDNGDITGLPPRHGDRTDPDRLRALILNNTEPAVATEVELVQIDEGLEVAAIEIAAAPSPVGSKAGVFLRRATKFDGSPECVPYRAHEIISAGLSAQGRDYAETPARGARMSDLDPREFDSFRRLCGDGRGDRGLAEADNEDVLRALRVVRPDTGELTLGAVLLFGRESALFTHVPTAEVLFQESTEGEITTNQQLRLPLFRVAERIRELIEVRNTEQEFVLGLHRVGVPRLPDGIVREVVANALIHRDYSELGPIAVRLSEDQLQVSSPGGLPPGITLRSLLTESRPRSVILADAFKRAGLVDRYGRGVSEVYRQLLRLGRDGPDYSATSEKSVIVDIPTSDADLEMVRFVIEYEESEGKRLTLLHLRILHEIKAMGDGSISQLASSLDVADVTVRGDLARLTELGLVEPRGSGRGRRFHLTAAFYRKAASSAYVRLQDTEPIQQDHMVLAYVDQWGSITRSKAAELCRLSPLQARTTLRRLVDAGELELRGERRGAHYVRPGRN
ncbi:RNA-binding domain-containing protein [Microlunatus parietis]|uniref:ATP-dependent DNA helicase RecG n=1 Tax=Microlunatus parietis TaxID=682979 RepID=A0A7Y9LCE1_9ACTN|nr:RNA-binding domain-containing protein [Microlunatus parietis]NYE71743.1 ATP-dependent DNA helicase RecG [Microlunatus parietis]